MVFQLSTRSARRDQSGRRQARLSARCGILLGLDSGLDLADFTPELLAEAERAAPVKPREPLPDFKPVKPPQAEPVRISSLRWEAANWELNEKLRHVERVTATARRRYDEPSPQTSAGPHFALQYIPAQPALIPRRSGTACVRAAAASTVWFAGIRSAISFAA